jgi:cephalosporin hydroxylase
VSQNYEELLEAWRLLKEIRPVHMLEIGSACGGSLYIYAGACDKFSRIVSITLPSYHDADCTEPLERVEKKLQSESYQPFILYGSSATEEMIESSKLYAPYQFIHIDGSHIYNAVKKDYENYSPLLESGYIFLHDLFREGVYKLWTELGKSKVIAHGVPERVRDKKAQQDHRERKGIGVVRA